MTDAGTEHTDSEHYRNAVARIEDRIHPKPVPAPAPELKIESAIRDTVTDLARTQTEAQADALRVVNRAIKRRGGKPGQDETPADAAAVFAIGEILTGLHKH